MSSDWIDITLAKLADINPKRSIPKNAIAPFIEMAALPTHARDISVSDIILRTFKGSGSKFRNGDTLLARITPCLENGKTALVSGLDYGVNGHGSTEFIVLGAKSFNDICFLYYLSRSDSFRDYVIARMEGTSGRQRVPNAAVGEYHFLCPPPAKRKNIGDILSALDDRIALLRDTNTTLEAIAQAMFKSWFVDFDPVHAKQEGRDPEGMDADTAALFPDSFEESELGPVPIGWKHCSFKDAVSIFDSERVPLSGQQRASRQGQYPYYGAATLMDRIDDFLFDGVYFLMGEDGSVADKEGFPITQYVWGKLWVNNHAHVLQGKNGVCTEHVMLYAKRTNIKPYITGAVQAKLSQSNMWRIPFLMPPQAISEIFGEIIKPLFIRFRHNSDQAQTLASLRDTLLPRLISGQLRLPDVEEIIEEATA
jgi:restriction endonuclease S subunit